MQVSLIASGLNSWSGSVLVFGVLEGNLEEQLHPLEEVVKGPLIKNLNQQNFIGKAGESINFQLLEPPIQKLVLVGLGKPEKLLLEGFRNAAALGAQSSIGNDGTLGIVLPWNIFDCMSAAKAVAEATRLSLFKDTRFLSKPEELKIPKRIDLIGLPESAKTILQEVNPICAGVELARELVGAPPNSLTPQDLANTAIQIAKEKNLEVTVLEKGECEARKMGAYLAVAKGSDLDPKFIHLIYRPKGTVKKRLALVGKGLTFDSGGYNLKVGSSQIDLMKFDMGGSAVVIGAAKAIGEIRPEEIEVHFIVASCENMINGSAVHPGDIVQASNGKTIEINNTDAEGRLTLADALVYTCELKPDAIVDLATLTGACVIALGDEIAGFWTDNNQLAEELQNAANNAGEGLWRMPIQETYKKGLKSMLADIKNTGPRAGGSITAALFLKEFVTESIPWAHIDIAGPVWAEKTNGLNPAGATGYGVRTIVNWICNQKT